jgi:site-specific DNA-methyltransferase (adenine-specific)
MTQVTTTLIQKDSLTALGELNIRSKEWSQPIHAIITDPPYWTLDKWRAVGTTTRLGGHRDPDKRTGWFPTIDESYLQECIKLFADLLPRNGHAWVMCDGQTLRYVLNQAAFPGSPFKYVKPYPVLKLTKNGKLKQGMGYHGRAVHEFVVLLEKGRRRFSDENWPDYFPFDWRGDAETRPFTSDGKPYPTAKPLALFQRLIELSSSVGETVLDPFSGSGTLAVAAETMQRDSISIDIGDEAMRVTSARLKSLYDERSA